MHTVKIMTVLTGLFVVPIMLMSVVAAQESAPEQSTTTATESSTEQKPFVKRIQDRKDKRTERLSAVKARQLESRCKAAQGRLSSVKSKQGSVLATRQKLHNNMTERLDKLVVGLSARSLDVTKLKAEVETFKTLTASFELSYTEYQTAVDDLVTMDCASDPEGFQASLEDARTKLGQAREHAAALKIHLKDVIKPELQALRIQIGAAAQTQGGATE